MVQSRKPDPIQELRECLQITESILDNAESFTFSPYSFALQHMAIEVTVRYISWWVVKERQSPWTHMMSSREGFWNLNVTCIICVPCYGTDSPSQGLG